MYYIPVVEAHQWFKNGDHPKDNSLRDGKEWEGHVVRYYRRPDISGKEICSLCMNAFHNHGWIDDNSNEGSGKNVCPGNWVVKYNEEYRVHPNSLFREMYRPYIVVEGGSSE